MDWGWGLEVRSRVWLHLLLPSHAQSLPFISPTQHSSFKLKSANSPHSGLGPFSMAWTLASPPQSRSHLAGS